MNDNKELNTLLDKLFNSVKDAYGIASMIKDIKDIKDKDCKQYYSNVDNTFGELKDKEVVDKPKDYEILTFAEPEWNEIEHYKKKPDGEFRSSLGEHYTEKYLRTKYPIFSVKRLSDNEVFRVHDKCCLGRIQEFVISDFGMYAVMEFGKKNLNDIQKVKERKMLFITTDGKEIFEGDEFVWVVDPEDYACWTVNAKSCGGGNKYFSTEENAKTYLYHNKPCLSYNDAVHWLASDGSGYGLYEIVKKKIDKK